MLHTCFQHFRTALAAVSVLCFLAMAGGAAGKTPLALENGVLRVEVAPSTGALRVVDKRNGHVWTQVNVEADPEQYHQQLADIDLGARTLQFECVTVAAARAGGAQPARFRIKLVLDATKPEMTVTFVHDKRGEWQGARYPYVFALAGEDARILYPQAEGMLVPVRKASPDFLALPERAFYGGTRACQACVGLLESETGGGMLTIYDTVEPAFGRWPEVTVDADQVIAPQLSWRASRYQFARPFEVKWCFFDSGGYVAMAARYREWFAQRGLRKTLAEKARENPALDRLIGGMILWHCGAVSRVRVDVEALAEDQVKRALIALPPPPRLDEKGELVDEPGVPELMEEVEKLGYLADRYDQYRDAFAWDPTKNAFKQCNSDAFPRDVIHREDGSMLSAFGPASGVLNPDRALDYAKKRLPKDLERTHFNASFLDRIGSDSFDEGEDWSPEHPCDLFETRKAREDLMAYVKSLKLLLGVDCGLDYTLRWADWCEGPTTLVGFLGSDSSSATRSVADAAPPANETEWGVNLGTKYRIPFWSLVHHDEAIATWQWADGMAGDAGALKLGQWQRKNLWSVLYGGIPLYRLYHADFEKCRAGIAQTARYVGDWARRVGYDAMTSHRFVTADHLVQETKFSSGLGVVVNFGTTPYAMDPQLTIPSESYRTFKEGAQRSYEEPPPPEMNYRTLGKRSE